MTAASGFAASVLFLLQMSYFVENVLLQVVELQVAQIWGVRLNCIAANGTAASAHTPTKSKKSWKIKRDSHYEVRKILFLNVLTEKYAID